MRASLGTPLVGRVALVGFRAGCGPRREDQADPPLAARTRERDAACGSCTDLTGWPKAFFNTLGLW